MEEKQKPIHKIRAGNITGDIWQTKKDFNGRKVTFYNASITKNYKDGEEWKTTNSFNNNDLPKLALVANKAFEWIMSRSESEEN